MEKKLDNITPEGFFDNNLEKADKDIFSAMAKELHRNMLELTPKLKGRLLDIGCGSKPYKSMCTNVDEYLGIEIDDEYPLEKTQADYLYDGKVMPLDNNSFDCALSSEVLEHVFDPDVF